MEWQHEEFARAAGEDRSFDYEGGDDGEDCPGWRGGKGRGEGELMRNGELALEGRWPEWRFSMWVVYDTVHLEREGIDSQGIESGHRPTSPTLAFLSYFTSYDFPVHVPPLS